MSSGVGDPRLHEGGGDSGESVVPDGDAFKVFVVDSSGLARARAVTIGARADSLSKSRAVSGRERPS